jgi:hypothetical protein
MTHYLTCGSTLQRLTPSQWQRADKGTACACGVSGRMPLFENGDAVMMADLVVDPHHCSDRMSPLKGTSPPMRPAKECSSGMPCLKWLAVVRQHICRGWHVPCMAHLPVTSHVFSQEHVLDS